MYLQQSPEQVQYKPWKPMLIRAYPSYCRYSKITLSKYSREIGDIYGNEILYSSSDFTRRRMLHPSFFVSGSRGPNGCVFLPTRFVPPPTVTRQSTHCYISTTTNIHADKEKYITL